MCVWNSFIEIQLVSTGVYMVLICCDFIYIHIQTKYIQKKILFLWYSNKRLIMRHATKNTINCTGPDQQQNFYIHNLSDNICFHSTVTNEFFFYYFNVFGLLMFVLRVYM